MPNRNLCAKIWNAGRARYRIENVVRFEEVN